uniref:Uncharacterized protein n=1 Tax=Cacopsylla melanoneura TaxID=428564 RepID=A0A8D8VC61_9HEMI
MCYKDFTVFFSFSTFYCNLKEEVPKCSTFNTWEYFSLGSLNTQVPNRNHFQRFKIKTGIVKSERTCFFMLQATVSTIVSYFSPVTNSPYIGTRKWCDDHTRMLYSLGIGTYIKLLSIIPIF